MIQLLSLNLLALLLFSSCIKDKSSNDFAQICDIAIQFDQSLGIDNFIKLANKELSERSAPVQAVTALRYMEQTNPDERYKQLLIAATEEGHHDFDCPKLKEILNFQ
jgi:hypothetical protein